MLLNKNIHPDPFKRETLRTTQEEFYKLINFYCNWDFTKDLSFEKYEYFLEKILRK